MKEPHFLRAFCHRFIRNEQGSIFIFFAIGAIMLVVAGGAAIDLGLQQLVNLKKQQSADAAATSTAALVGAGLATEAQITPVANRYYQLNLAADNTGARDNTPPTVRLAGGFITVTAPTTNINTHFVSVTGTKTLPTKGASTVTVPGHRAADYDVVIMTTATTNFNIWLSGQTSPPNAAVPTWFSTQIGYYFGAFIQDLLPDGCNTPNTRVGYINYAQKINQKLGLTCNPTEALQPIRNWWGTQGYDYTHLGMLAAMDMLSGGTSGVQNIVQPLPYKAMYWPPIPDPAEPEILPYTRNYTLDWAGDLGTPTNPADLVATRPAGVTPIAAEGPRFYKEGTNSEATSKELTDLHWIGYGWWPPYYYDIKNDFPTSTHLNGPKPAILPLGAIFPIETEYDGAPAPFYDTNLPHASYAVFERKWAPIVANNPPPLLFSASYLFLDKYVEHHVPLGYSCGADCEWSAPWVRNPGHAHRVDVMAQNVSINQYPNYATGWGDTPRANLDEPLPITQRTDGKKMSKMKYLILITGTNNPMLFPTDSLDYAAYNPVIGKCFDSNPNATREKCVQDYFTYSNGGFKDPIPETAAYAKYLAGSIHANCPGRKMRITKSGGWPYANVPFMTSITYKWGTKTLRYSDHGMFEYGGGPDNGRGDQPCYQALENACKMLKHAGVEGYDPRNDPGPISNTPETVHVVVIRVGDKAVDPVNPIYGTIPLSADGSTAVYEACASPTMFPDASVFGGRDTRWNPAKDFFITYRAEDFVTIFSHLGEAIKSVRITQ